jgi:pimeloyl-ACP methyl ester carboxylesterase
MLSLFLIFTLLLVVAAAVLLMAEGVLRPPRMTDGKAAYILKRLSPGDLGMAFEFLTFAVGADPSSRIELAAWWMAHPAGGDRTVVLIHGYADAKVGAIAWAPLWRELGFHILAIDLRAHGQSAGVRCTAGYLERHDLEDVINQFRATRPQQTRTVVLFGVSMGAAVAIATAALRSDIGAVVADCPYAHFGSGLAAHAELLGLPLPSLRPLVLRAAQWISDADFDAVAPAALIPTLSCPLLVIQSGNDPFVPPDDQRAIAAAMEALGQRGVPAVRWALPQSGHLLALADDPGQYRQQISDFLSKLPAPPVHDVAAS